MYAVPINRQSLDLIATNNGGLKPIIEMGANGRPGTYFVLEDNPNAHAKIVPVEDFFEQYEFVEPESLTEFRRVEAITRTPYRIDRNQLAQEVAGHTSGIYGAIAEQVDYDIADEILALLEKKLSD